MSTKEIQKADPLGGILHPNWESRHAAETEAANHFFVRRYFDRLVSWVRYDEPNLTTGDTRLSVDEDEMENPQSPSPQQARDIEVSVAAFEGVGPVKSDFYEDLFGTPESRSSSH